MNKSRRTLSPYLNFDGNTKEAMQFYHSILGGELSIQTFGEAKMARTPEEKDRVIHANLKSDNISLYASDSPMNMKTTFGDNVHLSLTGYESDKLDLVFSRLSEGGTVDMPLAKQFWGDTFGMVTDKFGMHWMVNISSQP